MTTLPIKMKAQSTFMISSTMNPSPLPPFEKKRTFVCKKTHSRHVVGQNNFLDSNKRKKVISTLPLNYITERERDREKERKKTEELL